MQKLEDIVNIVGQINEHPILPLSKPARYFIQKNKIGYLYALEEGSEVFKCFTVFNQWRWSNNGLSFFKNNEFLEIIL